MAPAVILVVGVLAVLVFLLLGVVVELHRDVRQLRDALGILDRPLDVDLGAAAGGRPSAFGLPAALDGAGAALVLFLSDRCGTCHALAAGLAGGLPPGLWVVLEARSPAAAAEFLAEHGFDGASTGGRLVVDVDGRIAGRIGLRTTPVGFRVEHGVLASATTVPSRRYLSSVLAHRVRLEPPLDVPRAAGGRQSP